MPHWVYRSGEDTLTIPRALVKHKAYPPPPPRIKTNAEFRPTRVPSEELTQSERGDRADSEDRRRDEHREHDFQQGVASGKYGADWVWTPAWTDTVGRPSKKAWKENPLYGKTPEGSFQPPRSDLPPPPSGWRSPAKPPPAAALQAAGAPFLPKLAGDW